jgi:hypothetical protein
MCSGTQCSEDGSSPLGDDGVRDRTAALKAGEDGVDPPRVEDVRGATG